MNILKLSLWQKSNIKNKINIKLIWTFDGSTSRVVGDVNAMALCHTMSEGAWRSFGIFVLLTKKNFIEWRVDIDVIVILGGRKTYGHSPDDLIMVEGVKKRVRQLLKALTIWRRRSQNRTTVQLSMAFICPQESIIFILPNNNQLVACIGPTKCGALLHVFYTF